MSEEVNREHVEHEKCGHCHGEGHTECHTCHGKKTEECPTCHGKKDVKCSKCGGHGHFSDCPTCYSTGKVDCNKCGGTGKIHELCPNCSGSRRVQKTRLRTCSNCHGRGEVKIPMPNGQWRWERCSRCNGSCQVEERYSETCPTCGGTGRSPYEITCPKCNGRKEFTCSRCHGTGHAECSACSGTGKVTCGECYGKGEITCRDCNGGGDHVCVDCYGTGDKLTGAAPKKPIDAERFKEAMDLRKKNEFVKAFEIYRELAVKQHSAAALRRLGGMYLRGDAVYKSSERANALYRVAANAGDIRSLYLLGKNYLDGVGVATKDSGEKNRSEARRLLELATRKGCNDAEPEYMKVTTARLVKNALSGVVGWRGKFEVPKFLLEADPAADQKDKDAKEAARKAEEARKERARKRAEFFARFFRGCWWLLFRASAAGVYYYWCVNSDGKVSKDMAMKQVGWYLAISYLMRPKFADTGYFLIALTAGLVPYFVIGSYADSVNIMLLLGLTTCFMRFVGEKLSFALVTYPLLGALVGFISSPYISSHRYETNFFTVIMALAFIVLPVLLFLVNGGLVHNAGGLAVKGKRQPDIKATLVTFAMLGGLAAYIFFAAKGTLAAPERDDDKAAACATWEKAGSSASRRYSTTEQGVCYRDGDGVQKDMARAKACFVKAIKDGDHEAEYHLANILIDEGDVLNGEQLLAHGAAVGYAPSVCRLGELRMKNKNEEEAVRLWKMAAEKDSLEAMLRLGTYYAEKTGIFGGCRDKDLAINYYTMAADKGNDKAKELLQALKDD